MWMRITSRSRFLARERLFARPSVPQRRNMGGGGGFMETNAFGTRLGEFFGTVAWLWVFHRFSQDGAVLLGYQHPWEHGDHGHDHGTSHAKHSLSREEVTQSWENFSMKSVVPGDEDEEEDSEDQDEDEDDDDE